MSTSNKRVTFVIYEYKKSKYLHKTYGRKNRRKKLLYLCQDPAKRLQFSFLITSGKQEDVIGYLL